VRARAAGRPRRSTWRCRPRYARRASTRNALARAVRPRRAEPRRGNRAPDGARSAGLHPPPRRPGRRRQRAGPPPPRRVTAGGGQQRRIRDDRVVRGSDGGRQILRIVSIYQHPRARARSHRPAPAARTRSPSQGTAAPVRADAHRAPCPLPSPLNQTCICPPWCTCRPRIMWPSPQATAHPPPARWPGCVTGLGTPEVAWER
jgi:hypothetical protein